VVDARELEHAAAEVRQGTRRAGEAALLAVAAGAGSGLAWLLAQPLALPLLAGAVLEALLGACRLHTKRDRIARLALEPAAYVIPEVQRYGQRVASLGHRIRLSAWILEMLREAHLSGNVFLGERVLQFARELEGLARDLMQPEARVGEPPLQPPAAGGGPAACGAPNSSRHLRGLELVPKS
jgi:hypothetical protein